VRGPTGIRNQEKDLGLIAPISIARNLGRLHSCLVLIRTKNMMHYYVCLIHSIDSEVDLSVMFVQSIVHMVLL
jgi:hypothetical protein